MKIFILGTLFMLSCSLTPTTNQAEDPSKNKQEVSSLESQVQHLNYLEVINSPQVNQFIKSENEKTFKRLKTDPLFPILENEIREVLNAQDKLPAIFMIKDDVYQFWQDQKNVRGQLKRMPLSHFQNKKNQWEVILDIDELSKAENKNWVWKGLTCESKYFELCMIQLSDGGKDAKVMREFNLKNKKFIENGFQLPESKSQIEWLNKDTLLIADASNEQTITTSGYARKIVYHSRNNQNSLHNQTLYEVEKSDLATGSFVQYDGGQQYLFFTRQISFYKNEVYYIAAINNYKNKIKIPIPDDADILAVKNGLLFFNLKSEWEYTDKNSKLLKYRPGSVVALNFKNFIQVQSDPQFELVYQPTDNEIFQTINISKDQIFITVLNNVKKSILEIKKTKKWEKLFLNSETSLYAKGNLSIQASHPLSRHIILNYTDFLTPTQYLIVSKKSPHSDLKFDTIMRSPDRFNKDNLEFHQYKVKSKDDTMIPYFVVHQKNIKLDGSHPTLLYGYGGFEYALTSHYLGALGKAWLSRGGIYVLSNIRGGGEFGPQWHKAALQENRHKAFEDFFAIAEDLIQRKLTSPLHLGAQGGSNGGLLTSVALTQRPDLFNAIVSEVPLTNMMKYHQWLAGASWMEEYGNPTIPQEKEFLLKYSPLHNIKKNRKYPEALYITSTKDDRVHPAHARQMVARLQELGHSVLYFENTDGGHGRASNLNEYATMMALELTYLFQKLK